MKLSDFDYDLPEERIALHPAAPRDAARLLVLDRSASELRHRRFSDLADYLRPGDALVINETRVRRARLIGRRRTGGRAEFLLVAPHADGGWEALARPSRRLRAGESIQLPRGRIEVLEALERGRKRVRVADDDGRELDPEVVGLPALPPYIRREPDDSDRERYQTVFARESGAIAAPTAGLHFTEPLVARLLAVGVRVARVVLHVGVGTFEPVRSDDVARHRIEPEYYRYPDAAAETIRGARNSGGRVVSVGTTCARVLETVGPSSGPRDGWTDLFIHPPYEFRAIDALVTNFHLPRSTLLMLVCAFAGRDRVLRAYEEARDLGYRFYSYGDAMLIL
jgi:S-adenosylmethionine:tRNA ribosyltransferase-isomerase